VGPNTLSPEALHEWPGSPKKLLAFLISNEKLQTLNANQILDIK